MAGPFPLGTEEVEGSPERKGREAVGRADVASHPREPGVDYAPSCAVRPLTLASKVCGTEHIYVEARSVCYSSNLSFPATSHVSTLGNLRRRICRPLGASHGCKQDRASDALPRRQLCGSADGGEAIQALAASVTCHTRSCAGVVCALAKLSEPSLAAGS
eukprot:scaffold2299_cov359-Prasinococcus_capsulatus_cf.AAC.1